MPRLTGPVVDQAGILSESTQRTLELALQDLKNRGTMQLQVLTVQSLGGLEIEEASIKVTDQWKLGDKDTDKGVLFLIAPNERKMRIEVGQGLEGDIPDVIAKRIIADVVTPYFKNAQYDSGVKMGVVAIARQVDPHAFDGVEQTRPASKKKGLPIWVFILIIFVVFLRSIFGGGGGGRFGGGRGFGGGFGGGGFGGGGGGGWSGGGGGFSGGGSSGSW